MPEHTDREYEADLRQLRQAFLRMGGLAEQLMTDALQATFNRDEKLALTIPERDKQVNRSEVEVDELCRRILALRQPTASDLRFVTFVMKAVTDLERIGDLAVNVADRALALAREPPLPYPQELSRMSELAQDMLHRALDCFVNEDTAVADEIMHSDDKVDDLYWTLFRRVLALMQQDPSAVERATSQLFVAKHVERLADHATNLAEMVIFMVRGEDVRHPHSRVARS